MLMNTKTKVILSFITIFLLGGVSGYLVRDSLVLSNRMDQSENYRDDRNRNDSRYGSERERTEHRAQMRERARNRLTNYLNLSEEQKTDFFSLLQTYQSEIRDSVQSIRSMESSYIREHYDEFKDDLSVVLSNQQLDKMDRFFHPDSVRHNRMNRNHRN